jgi:hypothetical protein
MSKRGLIIVVIVILLAAGYLGLIYRDQGIEEVRKTIGPVVTSVSIGLWFAWMFGALS